MPPYLLYGAIGYAVLSLVAAIFVTRRLSKGKNALIGMLPALVLSLVAYAALIIGAILYGFADGLILFCLAECAPIVSTAIYARLRVKRYQKLAEAYKEQRKAERPAIVTTMKMRRALQGFSVASALSEEAQHEIVILLQNGTDPKVITSFYNCRESELVKISRAFEAHMAKNAPVPKAKGVDYTASAHQREFLLRLMMTSTPSGLACGEGLLWQEDSVATLIHKSSGILPSRDSVFRFFDECGILLREEHFAFSETPEAKLWEKTQYEKIRMAALENSIGIYWIYALPVKGYPYTALIATNPEKPTVFGIYKEHQGLGDFLNKLSSSRIFAILCFKQESFKKFTNPPPNITLFPYGERRDIPDT